MKKRLKLKKVTIRDLDLDQNALDTAAGGDTYTANGGCYTNAPSCGVSCGGTCTCNYTCGACTVGYSCGGGCQNSNTDCLPCHC
jgi:hypothetical protein